MQNTYNIPNVKIIRITHERYVAQNYDGTTLKAVKMARNEKNAEKRSGILSDAGISLMRTCRKGITHRHPVILPCGGKTVAVAYDADGNEISRAEALCSINDNYHRRCGIAIAIGRIAKNVKNKILI
jgi:hypothetical protein